MTREEARDYSDLLISVVTQCKTYALEHNISTDTVIEKTAKDLLNSLKFLTFDVDKKGLVEILPDMRCKDE